jgi:hypothetical protein
MTYMKDFRAPLHTALTHIDKYKNNIEIWPGIKMCTHVSTSKQSLVVFLFNGYNLLKKKRFSVRRGKILLWD